MRNEQVTAEFQDITAVVVEVWVESHEAIIFDVPPSVTSVRVVERTANWSGP